MKSRSQPLRAVIGAAVLLVVVVVVIIVLRPGGERAGGRTSPPAPAPGSTVTASAGAPTPAPTGSASPPVPAPSPGTPSALGSGSTVPVEPVRTKKAVPLEEPGDLGKSLSLQVRDVVAVEGKATAPGEIAGPALKITLRATNRSGQAVSLAGSTVFVTYGADRTPASELSDGRRPFPDELPDGEAREGVYLYSVPEEGRDDLRIEVSRTGAEATVAFEGGVG
ncbi:hypothetical protein GCM10009616_01160 [Microlunatus lacustris]